MEKLLLLLVVVTIEDGVGFGAGLKTRRTFGILILLQPPLRNIRNLFDCGVVLVLDVRYMSGTHHIWVGYFGAIVFGMVYRVLHD